MATKKSSKKSAKKTPVKKSAKKAVKKSAAKKAPAKKAAKKVAKKAPAKKAAKKTAAKKSTKSASKKAKPGNRYAPAAHKSVEREMKAMHKGTLRSSSGQKVTNPKQAIAIGLSEARHEGADVPPNPNESH